MRVTPVGSTLAPVVLRPRFLLTASFIYLNDTKNIVHIKTPIFTMAALRCSFYTLPIEAGAEEAATPLDSLWFRPNQGKRSSFFLDLASSSKTTSNDNDENTDGGAPPTHHAISGSPCHCYVTYVPEHDANDANAINYFFLGGFQLISTARSVEVYATRKGSNQKEELLMTCRGIPVREKASDLSSDCFKVFSVVPGGPRPVTQLHLKLVAEATNDDNNTDTKLVSIQLTGRLPDPQQLHQHQQPVPTPRAQITPSSAMMMQQMMLAASGGATPSSSAGLFSAPTPLASGSTPRYPFFSPHSSSEVGIGNGHGTGSSSSSNMRPPSSASSTMQTPMTPFAAASTSSFSAGAATTPATTTQSHAYPSVTANSPGSSETIIAGISFLVRSEGQATVHQVQTEIHKHEVAVQQRLQSLEQTLQQQQAMMQAMMQQQQIMMQRQFETMTLLQQQQQQQQMMMQQTMAVNAASPNHALQQEQQQQRKVSGIQGSTEQNVPFSPMAQASSSSQNSNTSSPSTTFPTESPYDPTCRIKKPDCPNFDDNGQVKTDDGDGEDAKEKEIEDTNEAKVEDETADVSNGKENDDDDSEDAAPDAENQDRNDDGESGSGGNEEGNNSNGDKNSPPSRQSKDCPGSSSQCDKENAEDTTGLATLSELNTESDESRGCPTDHSKADNKVQRQIKFETSPQGFFPTIMTEGQQEYYNFKSTSEGDFGRIALSSKHAVVWENKELSSESHSPPSSIENNASMVGSFSIQCSNRGAAALQSLPSMPANSIDQAESIEVLAVFPESPPGSFNAVGISPQSTSSSVSHQSDDMSYGHVQMKRHLQKSAGAEIDRIHTAGTESSQSVGYDNDNDIDDENPSYESSDSIDDSDLVSVSLQENEKENSHFKLASKQKTRM